MMDGDVQSENGAIAPADDGSFSKFQEVHDRQYVRGHQIVAEGFAIARATPMTATVHDHDLIMRSQNRDQLAPIVGIGEAAVQKNNWHPAAKRCVPYFNAVNRRISAFRMRWQAWSRRQSEPWWLGRRDPRKDYKQKTREKSDTPHYSSVP